MQRSRAKAAVAANIFAWQAFSTKSPSRRRRISLVACERHSRTNKHVARSTETAGVHAAGHDVHPSGGGHRQHAVCATVHALCGGKVAGAQHVCLPPCQHSRQVSSPCSACCRAVSPQLDLRPAPQQQAIHNDAATIQSSTMFSKQTGTSMTSTLLQNAAKESCCTHMTKLRTTKQHVRKVK